MKLHCVVKPPKIKLGKLANTRADRVELHSTFGKVDTPASDVFQSMPELLHATGNVPPHVDGPNGYAGKSFVSIVIKGSNDHIFYTAKDIMSGGTGLKKNSGVKLTPGTMFVVDSDVLHWVEYNESLRRACYANLFLLQWTVDTEDAKIAFQELKKMYQ